MKVTMLILHFLGLAMGLGTGFAHAFLGNAESKMDRTEAKKFRLQIKSLSTMGNIGTIMLIGSGIYLIIPYWPSITAFPLLILKLVLVAILEILVLLIGWENRRAYKDDAIENSKRLGFMGKLTLMISITIIIIAVNIFH